MRMLGVCAAWALMVVLLEGSPSQVSAVEKRDARLVETRGSVWIRSGSAEWESVSSQAGEIPLEEGDSVKTGPKPSGAVIQLDKDNTVELSANTEFEITATDLAWSKFKLFVGSFLGKIEEKLEEKKRMINVITLTTTLAVRGTEFVVDTDPEGESQGGVGVFEGRLEATMNNLEGAPSVQINAGEEIDLVRSGPAPKPRALKRFQAVKKRMTHMRKRHAQLKARWRSLPLERRKAMRKRIKSMRGKMRGRRQGR